MKDDIKFFLDVGTHVYEGASFFHPSIFHNGLVSHSNRVDHVRSHYGLLGSIDHLCTNSSKLLDVLSHSNGPVFQNIVTTNFLEFWQCDFESHRLCSRL